MYARVLFAIAAAIVVNGCASSDGQSAAEAVSREGATLLPALEPGYPDPAPQCTSDSDCRLFDDYCGGCNCRALSQTAPKPSCKGKQLVACFVAPCLGSSPACVEGQCTAGGGAF